MKKFLAILLVVVLTTSMVAVAFADVSGYTSGGEDGLTWVWGTLSITNAKDPGADSAKGATYSYIEGTIGVKVTIYCTNENGKFVEGRGENSSASSTSISASATAPAGSYAYKATSSHTYVNSRYGSFAKSDSTSF